MQPPVAMNLPAARTPETTHRPADIAELQEIVRAAAAAQQSLEILAHGTRRNFGRMVNAAATLDICRLSGIIDYEPTELVLTARAATALSDIEAALAANRQQLAFEPPQLARLYGLEGRGTLGGCLSVGLGGPRRPSAGAPRDHLLGLHGVNGLGEAFKAGGRVVKNVTGFDLPKLLAGSLGTLAVLTEVTVRVRPSPDRTRTLLLRGLDDERALATMASALASPAQVSGAAHLPAELAGSLPGMALADGAITALRLEGFEPAVNAQLERLQQRLSSSGAPAQVLDETSGALWESIGAAACLAAPAEEPVWRITLPPASCGRLTAALRAGGHTRYLLDWGGALLWLQADARLSPQVLRARVHETTAGAGHASLMRGSQALRTQDEPLAPLPAPLSALMRRVKAQFDPHGVLNPGRLYATL
jgi:glycolate oxidase FAD binding subunit